MEKRSNVESTINFIYFTANFTGGFIQKAFKDDQHLATHLQQKLDEIISQEGKGYCTVNGFMKFMFELGTTQKKTLLEWIDQNYNCGMI